MAFVDTETEECRERRLTHREEAEQSYRKLRAAKLAWASESGGRYTKAAGQPSTISKLSLDFL